MRTRKNKPMSVPAMFGMVVFWFVCYLIIMSITPHQARGQDSIKYTLQNAAQDASEAKLHDCTSYLAKDGTELWPPPPGPPVPGEEEKKWALRRGYELNGNVMTRWGPIDVTPQGKTCARGVRVRSQLAPQCLGAPAARPRLKWTSYALTRMQGAWLATTPHSSKKRKRRTSAARAREGINDGPGNRLAHNYNFPPVQDATSCSERNARG